MHHRSNGVQSFTELETLFHRLSALGKQHRGALGNTDFRLSVDDSFNERIGHNLKSGNCVV